MKKSLITLTVAFGTLFAAQPSDALSASGASAALKNGATAVKNTLTSAAHSLAVTKNCAAINCKTAAGFEACIESFGAGTADALEKGDVAGVMNLATQHGNCSKAYVTTFCGTNNKNLDTNLKTRADKAARATYEQDCNTLRSALSNRTDSVCSR